MTEIESAESMANGFDFGVYERQRLVELLHTRDASVRKHALEEVLALLRHSQKATVRALMEQDRD